MAVSAAINDSRGVNESGNRRRVSATVTYASEAHSNGYQLPKSLFGFNAEIEEVLAVNSSPSDANSYKYDKANETIRIYDAAGAEVTSSLSQDVEVVAEGW
jgi:hypothetical protein